MTEDQMSKIITDLHSDINEIHEQWVGGKLKSIEAINQIKNQVKYLIMLFFEPR